MSTAHWVDLKQSQHHEVTKVINFSLHYTVYTSHFYCHDINEYSVSYDF